MKGLHLPERIVRGDFAGWLRDSMAARRMSTRLVAMRTGLNHGSVSRLMTRSREPFLSTAIALVKLFEREPLQRETPKDPDGDTTGRAA
jgi:transcriptional regulator with XRE-family HTH domain